VLRHSDEVDIEAVTRRFDEVVTMSASLLDQWLDSEEARAGGAVPPPEDELVEHAPGRRVVEVLRTPPDQLTDVDHAFMRRVVVHVEQELAAQPDDPEARTRWRCELMGWGHDPDA
jgi:hypothetical protein